MCPIAAAVWFVLMTITMQKPLDLPQIGIEFIVADTLLRDLHVNGELRSGGGSWAVYSFRFPLGSCTNCLVTSIGLRRCAQCRAAVYCVSHVQLNALCPALTVISVRGM